MILYTFIKRYKEKEKRFRIIRQNHFQENTNHLNYKIQVAKACLRKKKKIYIYITCVWCTEVGHGNTFTSGKSSEFPKVNDFSKQEKTLDHKFAIKAKYTVERKEMPKAASRASGKLNSIISTKKNIFFICKENIALEKSESLQELLIQQRCSQL